MNNTPHTSNQLLIGIKGIIFDYGGTLDSGGEHWSFVLRDGYKSAGVEIDYPQFREAYVFAERELARVRHILPHHNFHDLLLIKVKIELQWLAEHMLFPPQNIEPAAKSIADYCYDFARRHVQQADKVLTALHERYPIVLVSNFYGNIKAVLKDFGIHHLFDKIIESSVVGVRKPDPQIFRLGVDALHLPAEEVLVVGDSYKKDILPAASIGCRTLLLPGKQWDDTPIPDTPTISSITDLLPNP